LAVFKSEQIFLNRAILVNVKRLQILTPGLLLIVCDLTQIQYRLLHYTAVCDPAVFDDTVISMNLTILFSLVASEKHDTIISDKNIQSTPKVSTTSLPAKKMPCMTQNQRKKSKKVTYPQKVRRVG